MVNVGPICEPKSAAAGRRRPFATAWEVKKLTCSCLVLLHHGGISFGLLLDVFWNDFSIILESKIEAETKEEIGSQNVPSRIDFPPKFQKA